MLNWEQPVDRKGAQFSMIYATPVRGHFETNCYFYVDEDTKRCFLIDPGAEGQRLLDIARDNGWIIERILLTHGHFDHMGGIPEIRRNNDIPVYAFENADLYLLNPVKNLSRYCGPDITIHDVKYFHDGDEITFSRAAESGLKILHTPGHTEDSVVFYSEKEKAAFVGDTIFKGSIGSTAYPGGNGRDLKESIERRIFTLPDDTVLLSGHSEQTTVLAEKRRYVLYYK